MRLSRVSWTTFLGLALILTACSDDSLTPVGADRGLETAAEQSAADVESQLASMLDGMNASLSASGAEYRAVMAEAITAAESGEAGVTVLAKDVGNKQLSFDFLPGDTRRAWSGADPNTIDYAIDRTGDAVPVFGGLTASQTDAAIVRGHESWETLTCAGLGQARNDDFGFDIGIVAFQLSSGAIGSPFVFADVQHAGWRDLNFAGGVLGVTFTFGFIGGTCSGIFTDLDGDGKCDTAFREIYYDPSFRWADNGASNVDVESVAVHEIGHGLSQAHFGTVAFQNDGSLMRSPFAVMNAIYSQPLRVLQGTDAGGHCSIWGEWPNE